MRIINNSPIKTPYLKNSKNPIKLFQVMKIYTKERRERFVFYHTILNCLNIILTNCKLRIIEDKSKDLIAGYTYKIRKNRRWEKSMYLDTIVRNFENPISKNYMQMVYEDIKKIAQTKKAEEITLFSKSNDEKLQKKYEKLGFQKDAKSFVYGGHIMRAEIKSFLNNNVSK